MSSPLNPNAPPSARPPPADAADPGRKRKMTADASSALRMLETHLEGKQTPPPGATRPPALTVDISAIEMARQASGIEEAVPCTPANTRSAVRTDLHRSVSAGDIEAATSALAADASLVDVQEEHGWTPLHNAAALPDAEKRASLADLLLSHRADVSRTDNDGYTPLHWAAACGAAELVTRLLSAGAPITARSNAGETPLHRASRLGRVDVALRLLAAGAPPGAVNQQRHTPLDVAGTIGARVDAKLRCKMRRAIFDAQPSLRTLLLHHPDCEAHLTGDTHQEHPLRLEVILQRLLPARPVAAPSAAAPAAAAAAPSSSRSRGDALSYEVRPISTDLGRSRSR